MMSLLKSYGSGLVAALGAIGLIFSGGVTFGRSNVQAQLETHAGPVHEAEARRLGDVKSAVEELGRKVDRLTEAVLGRTP